MTKVVTVHTDFTDLDQMTQGLIGRVNDSHVILPAEEPAEAGEWVQFAVTLYDGSPAFAGVGRCVTFVDNGEDRMPHQRFDVVFDALQFDSRGQQIYEHILALSGIDVANAQPGTGDISVNMSASYESVNDADVSGASSMPAPMPDDEAESTMVASDGALREALAQSAVHDLDARDVASVPTPNFSGDDEEDGATNPPPPAGSATPVGFAPSNGFRPRELNGASFSYPDGLPFPAKPPRPDLAPGQQVTPAPRPED